MVSVVVCVLFVVEVADGEGSEVENVGKERETEYVVDGNGVVSFVGILIANHEMSNRVGASERTKVTTSVVSWSGCRSTAWINPTEEFTSEETDRLGSEV